MSRIAALDRCVIWMSMTRWLGIAIFAAAACARPDPPAPATPPQRVVGPTARELPVAQVRPACAAAGQVAPIALPELEASEQPSIGNLRSWVHLLAGPELRGRAATTQDALRAARVIADHFAAMGAESPEGSDYCRPFSMGAGSDVNVVAHLPSVGARCHVLIGAHYDALGVDAHGRIRPGADDNATGVAVLLELARLWRSSDQRPRVGVVLAAFGAEEVGLLGSAAYVSKPSVPLSEMRMMINVDMAGRRLMGNPGIGYEASGPDRARVARRVHQASFRSAVPVIAMRLGDRGDNASFSPHVPTVFFCTTVHPDYHQPTDTPARVDYEQTLRAARIVKDMVEHLDCAETVSP